MGYLPDEVDVIGSVVERLEDFLRFEGSLGLRSQFKNNVKCICSGEVLERCGFVIPFDVESDVASGESFVVDNVSVVVVVMKPPSEG